MIEEEYDVNAPTSWDKFCVGLWVLIGVLCLLTICKEAFGDDIDPLVEKAILAQCVEDYAYCARKVADEQNAYNEAAYKCNVEPVDWVNMLHLPRFRSAAECCAHLGACGYTHFAAWGRTNALLVTCEQEGNEE